MANLLDRIMKRFMKHIDLTPNKSDSETRMNAQAAGPKTTRAARLHGRAVPGKAGHQVHRTGDRQAHGRLSGLFHRGH